MPNLVAYNSGSTITNALQFGTIVMDVNNTVNLGSLLWCPDYGICNQYLIVTDSYTNGKTNQLTARAMGFQTSGLTNSDLIAGINKLASSKSAGPFGTLSDAINWAIYEGYFITNQEYPSIVTSGCVLNLDSNFPPSYPLVFNTWYDLTGNGNTGLLINGITYDSALRGSLVLNGTNQYVSFSATTGIPLGNSNYTISTWFNPSTTSGDRGLVGWGNFGTPNQVNALKITSSGLVNYWWANDLQANYSFTTGNWYNAVATFDGTTRSIYVNSSLIGSDTPVGHNVPYSTNLEIGVTNGIEFFGGNMGEVQIFDRALSSTEITQNYNALLPRYNGTYTDPCDIAPSCLYNCANCIGTGWIPYNATSCYQVVTSAATAPVSSIPLIRRGAVEYSQFGTQFYDEGFSIGGTGTILQTSLTAPLWYNSPNNTVNGPMNRCAIWYSAYTITNTWLGFSTCLSGISTTNTYYVGIAADNEFKLVLDGVTILNTTLGSMGAVNKFKYWHVYPVTIPSGNHTLELYGLDYGVIAGFGMEIYDNTLSELTGATTLNDLNVIFSSSGYTTADIVQTIGGEYLSSGYTCPSGFVYSTCSGNCIDYQYCYSTSPTPTTTTTPTPTPTPTTTPTTTCACYLYTNNSEFSGEGYGVHYTTCIGNNPTVSYPNPGQTITFCAVYGQPVYGDMGQINGGLCAGFVQPCTDDSDCSSCGSNTPTTTPTPTPTSTLVPSLGCSGGTISGTYSGNEQYTYPSQPVSSSVDSYINFSWGSLDRPNRFSVYDSTGLLWTSGWVGFADYAGPWGASLNTPSTGNSNICFLSSSGRYVLVEAGNASPISDAYDYVMTCLGSCPGGTTPTPTPTLTPTCDCVQFVNVEVTSSGVITYLDCNGVGQSQNVGIGPEVIGVATCINKNTLGGSASFTIDSIGPCCNVVTPTPTPTSTSTNTPTPSSTPVADKSLELRVLDIASTPQTITMFYSINGGGNINIPGGTSVIFPITCTLLYTIPGLTTGDVIIFGTSINCAMEGAGGTSCPGFVGSLTTYSYVVDAPTVQTLSLTIDTQDIP